MDNKKVWLGMLVVVFGFLLAGCGELPEAKGYTFEFKVEHASDWVPGSITKIEFINGSNENATVLETQAVNLSYGQMSSAYKISGFTEKDGDDKRILGVRITVRNTDDTEGTVFKWTSRTNNAKIRASLQPINSLNLYDGNW